MSRSLEIAFHGWRGVGPVVEPDLFEWRYRLGLATLTVCRVCVLTRYRRAKAEASRLREAIASAVAVADGKPPQP